MKLLKIIAVLFGAYVAVVAAFETFLGFSQPQGGNTVIITTRDSSGTPKDRVVSRLDLDGTTYVAANHWPRAWYRAALANPEVQVTRDGTRSDFTAVPATPAEIERLRAAFPHGIGFRILTGFPPRRFMRLDAHEAPVG
jgi:hypothetical protein